MRVQQEAEMACSGDIAGPAELSDPWSDAGEPATKILSESIGDRGERIQFG